MFHIINKIQNPGSIFLNDSKKANPILSSKISKQLKKIKEPVPRYFESINQISGYWSEGEYDLLEIFKLLKFEAFFFKAVQKKAGQLIRSGFSVRSDDDQITEYLDARFYLMGLQTGTSLAHIVEKIGYYLFACSNAFVIKVRDKDFEHASSYLLNGKEMHPVTGLFLAHPTQIKPRFEWVKFESGTVIKHQLSLTKWVFVNRRGIVTEFDPDDVVHFTLFKEDGMIYGTPDVIPVIDDIKTLRKMEEDLGLLAYRDLFPIIHYTVENPGLIEHLGGTTELDQAKRDLERMMQDGGIATDARHKINYIGSQGKHMELSPYLNYFRDRVFSGLGLSSTDMGIGKDISGNTAQSMSNQLMDSVKYAQQEITRQFDEMILSEIMLQSPFGANGLKKQNKPSLVFEEIDIEWKIKHENHAADQFTKGVVTIDEVRNQRGYKNLSDKDLKRTYTKLYDNQAGMALSKTSSKPKKAKSSKGKDVVKNTGSNSNITKSKTPRMKDSSESFILDQDLHLVFSDQINIIKDDHSTQKKFNTKGIISDTSSRIKKNILQKISDGIQDASSAVNVKNLDYKKLDIEINKIEGTIDRVLDNISELIMNDSSYINKAAVRIATTSRTEQTRAYNYAYLYACINSGVTKFNMKRYDSDEIIDSIDMQEFDTSKICPLHPNSKIIFEAV